MGVLNRPGQPTERMAQRPCSEVGTASSYRAGPSGSPEMSAGGYRSG